MNKVKVKTPVVELDGDEMTRVIWGFIKTRLILPYLDIDLKYFDLGIENRDRTDDQVTIDAANAIRHYGVGVKCATITPDEARMAEFGLRKLYRSPNGTIRTILDGTVFREPIVCRNIPRLVPHWSKPIVIGRHADGGIDHPVEMKIPGPGTVTLTFHPEGGGAPQTLDVFAFKAPGIAMGTHTTRASIDGFARASFHYGLARRYPVYLSTRLKTDDGAYEDRFQEIFDAEFKPGFDELGITYGHRLTDDMVAAALKGEGGYVWACKDSDGGAPGFGPLGLMTGILMSPDGRTVASEAAHGTVTRHFREHRQGHETSTNPIASIFAWTRGLAYRGEFDATPDVTAFADTLERVCIETVEAGSMTKDLALLIGKQQPHLDTRAFLDKIDSNLQAATN